MQGRISLNICRSIVLDDLPKANPSQNQNQSDAPTEDDHQPNKGTYDNENNSHNTDIQEQRKETLASITHRPGNPKLCKFVANCKGNDLTNSNST